ncbi:VOC family protein [Dyadobacter sp. CY356]|uniref:VOC family protein n=1 Tax=Dyadobacter sp. CY356 TaxID=2906442 RepID=UPI001F38322E|nr:VOC family protein [Dyadobacter sp. CY356]MCF0055281.1 hypothetical protein [Dyadobacter sp. CY356]
MAKLEVWANMPVKDVERTRDFFKQLGFKVNGSDESLEIASFIFSDDHFVIHFFRQDIFEQSAKSAVFETYKGSEIMFTIGAESQAAVDSFKQKVIQAGGKVVTEPMNIPEGYNFVFADPDAHLWNVFYHNPQ